jgi:hypothetical protein
MGFWADATEVAAIAASNNVFLFILIIEVCYVFGCKVNNFFAITAGVYVSKCFVNVT